MLGTAGLNDTCNELFIGANITGTELLPVKMTPAIIHRR